MKRKNPETSVAAYKSLDPLQLAEIYQKILWGIGQLGECTFEELAKGISLPKERVWKRLSELERNNLIYRPGNKRPLASGRLGFTWKLVKENESTDPVTEQSPTGPTVSDYSRNIHKIGKQLNLL